MASEGTSGNDKPAIVPQPTSRSHQTIQNQAPAQAGFSTIHQPNHVAMLRHAHPNEQYNSVHSVGPMQAQPYINPYHNHYPPHYPGPEPAYSVAYSVPSVYGPRSATSFPNPQGYSQPYQVPYMPSTYTPHTHTNVPPPAQSSTQTAPPSVNKNSNATQQGKRKTLATIRDPSTGEIVDLANFEPAKDSSTTIAATTAPTTGAKARSTIVPTPVDESPSASAAPSTTAKTAPTINTSATVTSKAPAPTSVNTTANSSHTRVNSNQGDSSAVRAFLKNTVVDGPSKSPEPEVKSEPKCKLSGTESKAEVKSEPERKPAKTESEVEVKLEQERKPDETESEVEVKSELKCKLAVTESEAEVKSEPERKPAKTESDAEIKSEPERKPAKTESEAKFKSESQRKPAETESEPEILKHNPDRYSPTNPNGKKKYCKQFLIAVCTHVCKLRDPYAQTIFSDKNSRGQSGAMPRQDSFQPHYFINKSTETVLRTSQHNYAGRNSTGKEKPRIVINSVSLTQDVELKTASNPWKPARAEKKEEISEEEMETLQLLKTFRGILNKLTPENFDTLAEKVENLPINTDDRLARAISVVFTKALDEPGFCELYGKLCLLLRNNLKESKFNDALLKKCQDQFNQDIYDGLNCAEREKTIEEAADPEVKKTLQEELYEDKYKARMRGLGLIKFIGELYKIDMLNEAIMMECILRLIHQGEQGVEESLECLCDLIKTIGKKLDSSLRQKDDSNKPDQGNKKTQKASQQQKKPQKNKTSATYAAATKDPEPQSTPTNVGQPKSDFDAVFTRLKKIQKDPNSKISNRIRFRLLDTIELRDKNNWDPRQVSEANPKKLEEIRKESEEKTRRMPTARKSMEGNRPASGKIVGGQQQSSQEQQQRNHNNYNLETRSGVVKQLMCCNKPDDGGLRPAGNLYRKEQKRPLN